MGKFKDITGRRFGHLVALKYDGGSFWVCRCDCGSVTKVRSSNLLSGGTMSCSHSCSWERKYSPYIGKQFGKLTLKELYADGEKCFAKFECECGREYISSNISNVLNGRVKSCGCLHDDMFMRNRLKRKKYIRRCEYMKEFGGLDNTMILISLNGDCTDCCSDNTIAVNSTTYAYLRRNNLLNLGELTKSAALAHELYQSVKTVERDGA